jgi:predicted Zn-dependent peptidase
VVVAAVATVAVAIAELRTVPVGDLRITQLDSGLTVATERLPGARSVATGAWVRVGARDEPAELCGVSHFLEHLLFKGTAHHSAQEISRAVDRVGGDLNAFTAKEYTAYYCRMPAAHRALAVSLLGEVVGEPALRDDDVESERQVILEELAMDEDNPDDVAHRRFAEALFPDHPLGRNTAGDPETVESIAADDVRRFFGRWYRGAAVVVAAAGPIDHDETLAQLSAAFAAVPAGGELPERPAPLPGGATVVVPDDTEQVHLVTGFPALRRADPDREALDVVNHVLGGGLSSRLFEEVREKRGLAYAVFSGTSAYIDGGALAVYAGTLPHHVGEVMEIVDGELASLLADGITDDELDVAIGYLSGAYELGLEDTGACLARTGGLLATLGKVRPVDEQIARWQAVTHDDVRRVIERVLTGPRVTVALGPVEAGTLPD